MFTKRCYDIVRLKAHSIHRHPFNQELQRGVLSKILFHAFLKQDRLYLQGLAKTHRAIAIRFSDEKNQSLFLQFSQDALNEIKTIDYYLEQPQELGFFHRSKNKDIQLPIINRYLEHMMHNALDAPIEIAIASVSPCFLIYSELGKEMQTDISADNPYKLWIDSYSSKKFLQSTANLMRTAESFATDLQQQQAMLKAFTISVNFEIDFWNEIYEIPLKEQIANIARVTSF